MPNRRLASPEPNLKRSAMLSLAGSMIGLWHVVVQICKFRSALGLLGLKCGIEI